MDDNATAPMTDDAAAPAPAPAGGDNESRLFVGSLSWGVRDDMLRAEFEKAGTVVDAHVVMDRMSGRSKGFAFVEMANAEEAQKAIEMWNEVEMDGRKIIVNVARPKVER